MQHGHQAEETSAQAPAREHSLWPGGQQPAMAQAGYRILVRTNTVPHSISWQARLLAAAPPSGTGLCQFLKLSWHKGPTSQPELGKWHAVRGAEDLHPKQKVQSTGLQ